MPFSALGQAHFLEFSLHRSPGYSQQLSGFSAVVAGSLERKPDHFLLYSGKVEVFVPDGFAGRGSVG